MYDHEFQWANIKYVKSLRPLIGMSGMPQVRVGTVGRAMRLTGNHTHFGNNCTHNSLNCTQFCLVKLLVLLVQLFSNCTQMFVITYTNS